MRKKEMIVGVVITILLCVLGVFLLGRDDKKEEKRMIKEETVINQTGTDQTGIDQTGTDQTGINQTGTDQTGTNQTGFTPTESEQSENTQSGQVPNEWTETVPYSESDVLIDDYEELDDYTNGPTISNVPPAQPDYDAYFNDTSGPGQIIEECGVVY